MQPLDIYKSLGYSLQANKKHLKVPHTLIEMLNFAILMRVLLNYKSACNQQCQSIQKRKKISGIIKTTVKNFVKKANPTKVKTHDFPDKRLGKVVPYGVYDIGKNKGWVSVGISSDTAEFAVNTIRTWWYTMG